MNKKGKLIINVLAAAGVTMVLYIALHEFGHLIVMLSAGATIDEFSIIGAHVSAHGGEYTNLSDLWLHANGALFPLISVFIYLTFYRRELNKTFYRVFSFFFSLIPMCSLFAWVFIPFAFINGKAPIGDDVTKFLFNFSQTASPLYVSAVAALLITIGAVLMIRKGVLKNYILEIKEFSKKE
ncbi:MAG: hypothetical protein Q4D51_08125 [Eubacteriales bacterium]|nr:hypothetical protein [Eubacteriales bacterium]